MSESERRTLNLAQREFVPFKDGMSALKKDEIEKLQKELDRNWKVVEQHHLEKEYKFDDFRQALDFTNKVGELAERLEHHPDIHLSWGKVGITLWTHKVDGLTEGDFVFAAKTDMLLNE